MNAAEITDKLGLHSLRQRAWVRMPILKRASLQRLTYFFTVYPINLCHIRRWSLRRFGMAQQLPPKGRTQLNSIRFSDDTEAWCQQKKPHPFPIDALFRDLDCLQSIVLSTEVLWSSSFASKWWRSRAYTVVSGSPNAIGSLSGFLNFPYKSNPGSGCRYGVAGRGESRSGF